MHWEDLLNVLRLLRDENSEKNSKLLRATLAEGFTRFLKVPPNLADQIIDTIL